MNEDLPNLYYQSNNKFEHLPPWAHFFLQLGHKLLALPSDHHRVVIGLAIPTRAFACALIGTGIVLAKSTAVDGVDKARIEFVRNLKSGTPVYVRADKKLRGVFKGIVLFNDKEYITVKIAETTEKSFSLSDYASRITVADEPVNLPKTQQNGYKLESPSKFLRCCLGEELAHTHIRNSSFDVLLIGKKSVIQHEVNNFQFGCKSTHKIIEATGCLQDILRVRQFSGVNKSYRTQCVSPSSQTLPKERGSHGPTVVIFDGATAYINLNHKYPQSHQIALLDRTERQFQEAVELINQNYTYRISDDPQFLISIPKGLEMMIYREEMR